jgi:hypothetical protein
MKFHLLKSFISGKAFQAELWERSSIYCEKASDWRPLDDEDPLIFNISIDVTGRLTISPAEKVSMLFHDEGAYQFRPVRKKWKLG